MCSECTYSPGGHVRAEAEEASAAREKAEMRTEEGVSVLTERGRGARLGVRGGRETRARGETGA